jgi:bacterioferritin B
MLISETMNGAINEQIGNEFSASLQYVAIASHFASEALSELAGHFYTQSEEERDHAMRFVRFLVEAGGHVEIPSLPMPRCDFKSAEDAVQHSLGQEKTVTQQINDLVELTLKESDHITNNFLSWFLTEQLEEVSSMEDLLRVVQRAGPTNLLFVEDYLARRGAKKTQRPAAEAMT